MRYYCGEIEEVGGAVRSFEDIRYMHDESGRIVDQVDNDVDDTFIATTKSNGGAIG